MSSIQVLIATMNKKIGDYSLLKKMNIQTDAIVCNQCDTNKFEEFTWNGHNIKWLSFAEKGVGLNRNNALMRATGQIVLFADDDMVYVDGYAEKIEKAFKKCPDADVLVFNLHEKVVTRSIISDIGKVGRVNYLRYGTARIAARMSLLKKNGIFFNQCFGGGTEHCHGEDNIFLTDCLNKGLKIYAFPMTIASLTEERESTWNTGYDKKYLKDQGCLYKAISRRWWRLLCFQDVVRRHKRDYKMSIIKAYRIMKGKM